MQEFDVCPGNYSIDGELKENALNIVWVDSHNYSVFYIERDEKGYEANFSTIEEAFHYLYEMIKDSVDLGKRIGKKLI